jgi:ElaB/YqjD/DUF883 family membrane-anchored ribosome-binding protein
MPDSTDERTPEEIERDIRATQDEMSRTVEQIGGEFTARNVVNSLLDKADQNGVNARAVLDTARRNPIALAMIALGGLWLVSEKDAKAPSFGTGRKQADNGLGHDRTDAWSANDHRSYVAHMAALQPERDEDEAAYRRRRDHARASYFMIEQGHDEDAHSWRQRLDAATERLRDGGAKAGAKASEGASALAAQSRAAAQQAVSGTKAFYYENPLVSGLAAAFVGAVAGSALPATRTEAEYVGGIGQQAMDSARSAMRKAGDEVRHQKDDLVGRVDETIAGSSNGSGQPSAALSQEQ